MTGKQKVIAGVSAVLLLALLGCTVASCVIYRRLLPEVETAPLERRELYLTVEAVGTIGPTEAGGRRIFCPLSPEDAAALPEACPARLSAGGKEDQGSALICLGPDGATAEVALPYTLRVLEDGAEVSVQFLLKGGIFNYVVPMAALSEANGQPCLLTVAEVDGLTGPELRVDQFPVREVLFTDGEYAAVELHEYIQPPEAVISWSSQPLARGDAAKWARTR